jgi:hypothetical protein
MRRQLALALGVVLLAGCGGGGSGSAPSAKVQPQSVAGKVIISIPTGSASTQALSRAARYPQFVSPNATSVAVSVNGGADMSFDVSPTSTLCTTVVTARNCTLAFAAPAGNDTFAFLIFEGPPTSQITLASATTTQNIVSGSPFNFTVGLSAVIGTVVANLVPTNNGGCPNSPPNNNTLIEGCVVSGTLNFTVSDPSGAPITGSAAFAGTGITVAANDPAVNMVPTQITAPGQTSVLSYNGNPFASMTATSITVSLTAGSLNIPLAVPITHSFLYLANSNNPPGGGAPPGGGDIAVFQYGAAGPVSPVRTITGLFDPTVPIVDASGNLYVLDEGTGATNPVIKVFAPGANGPATPIRQIMNIAALDSGQSCAGMIFDPTKAFIILSCGVGGGAQIYVFPVGANGAATTAVTAGVTPDGISIPTGMAFDPSGNLFIADFSADAIDEFPAPFPTSGGLFQSSALPISQFTAPGSFPSGLTPIGMKIDNSGTMYTSLFYFNLTGNPTFDNIAEIGIWKTSALPCTNCAPSAVMSGAPFTTHATAGLALDPAGNMYTVNPYNNNVTVFSRATVAAAGAPPFGTVNPTPLLSPLVDESAPGIGAFGMAIGP